MRAGCSGQEQRAEREASWIGSFDSRPGLGDQRGCTTGTAGGRRAGRARGRRPCSRSLRSALSATSPSRWATSASWTSTRSALCSG